MLSSGARLLFVQQTLGHSTATITLRYYAKWMPLEVDGDASLIDKCFESGEKVKIGG